MKSARLNVFVVSYENLGSSGGFDWFYNRNRAEDLYKADQGWALSQDNTQLFFFEFETSFPYRDYASLTEAELAEMQDAITNEIDESDYRDTAHKICISQFPHTQAEWERELAKYNRELAKYNHESMAA